MSAADALREAVEAVLANEEHAFSGGMRRYVKGSPTWQVYEDLRKALAASLAVPPAQSDLMARVDAFLETRATQRRENRMGRRQVVTRLQAKNLPAVPVQSENLLDRLVKCSSGDPNRHRANAGKWTAVNVPTELWNEITKATPLARPRKKGRALA